MVAAPAQRLVWLPHAWLQRTCEQWLHTTARHWSCQQWPTRERERRGGATLHGYEQYTATIVVAYSVWSVQRSSWVRTPTPTATTTTTTAVRQPSRVRAHTAKGYAWSSNRLQTLPLPLFTPAITTRTPVAADYAVLQPGAGVAAGSLRSQRLSSVRSYHHVPLKFQLYQQRLLWDSCNQRPRYRPDTSTNGRATAWQQWGQRQLAP